MRISSMIAALVAAVFLCACVAGRDKAGLPAPTPESLQMPAGLPGLGQLPQTLLRSTSGLGRITLGEADVVASANVSFDAFDGTASFDTYTDGMAYLILGVELGAGDTPARLDVFGSISDLWVAVSDYDSNTWRWLADGLQGSALLDIPAGTQPDSSDRVYVALVCVPYNFADYIETALVVSNEASGDSEPPVWTADEGIISVDYDDVSDWGTFDWGEATDPASGLPVVYLVYLADPIFVINWSRPAMKLVIPNGDPFTSELYLADNFTTFIAVRAMDSSGNMTANTNYISETTGPGDERFGWFDAEWQPGDRLVLRWDKPANDLGLYVSAPNFDEAYPPDQTFLGRSFAVSEDSEGSGLAEESVWLRPTAPGGYFTVILQTSGGNTNAVLELHGPDGTVKQVLGEYDPNGLNGEADIGYLHYIKLPG
jgi:hypothetical protein